MANAADKLKIFITSPLEEENVARIRAVAPDRVEVLFEPGLFPPLRYVADHKGVEGFQRTPQQEELWRLRLSQADILWDFPALVPNGAADMKLATNVKWVQTTSSGVGQLVTNLGLQGSDIVVTTAGGVHSRPLSEFALLAILMHVKRLAHLQSEQVAHHWERYCGEDLKGKVLGLVGTGHVGGKVGEVCRFLGMEVIALDTALTPERATELGYSALYPPSGLHDLLGRSDVVVLSVPHTPDTEHMIDGPAFDALKDGAVFINIARGQVVDEPALIESLRSGKIGFAALDVCDTEPLPADSPLWDFPNVLISPQSASTVTSENANITDIFCHNLACYLEDRFADMRNTLDKARMF